MLLINLFLGFTLSMTIASDLDSKWLLVIVILFMVYFFNTWERDYGGEKD